MKKTARKALEGKLLTAVNAVLQANKIGLTSKTETTLEKSIKKITRKIAKKRTAFPQKTKKAGLGTNKVKTPAIAVGGTTIRRVRSKNVLQEN